MAGRDPRSLFWKFGPTGVLVAAFGFMVWVRTRPAERVVSEGQVWFSGNDPWYHARIVQYTVRHFPSTPLFDPWTNFPFGTGPNTGFGGLFDQLIALAALIGGLGSSTPHFTNLVTAYAPVVFGALTIIPLYFISKWLMNRWWALLSVAFLALVNGQFLTRTVVGSADHQSAEAFFGTMAVAGLIYAFAVARIEQPMLADLRDRNWIALRRPVAAAVIGGVALAAYLMMWPPGVMLVFTIGVFLVLQQSRSALRRDNTEFVMLGLSITFLVAGVLTLLYANEFTIEVSNFSLLQPLVSFGVGIGLVVMWVIDDQLKTRGYDPRYVPLSFAGLITGGLGLMAAIYPTGIGMLQSLFVRVYSFGFFASPTARTVREVAPARPGDAWNAFAALFALALVGLLIMGYRVLREDRPKELLVVIWSLTMLSAYFTMIRFGYYFAVNVAILAGYAIWWTAKISNLHDLKQFEDLETYQVLVVLILVVAVVPGNVIAVGGTSPPAWETANRLGGVDKTWHEELSWLNNNTPQVPMDYYGPFERPEDRDYDYPQGAYGVISWWDYGHWITYTGERIPTANPFQQGALDASAFLLTSNETRANLVLEAMSNPATSGHLAELSNRELRKYNANQTSQQAGEDTRYVIIDDQMAAGKFNAIATWTGEGPQQYYSEQEFQVAGSQARLVGTNNRYQNTMLARLYLQDARGLSHYRLVHETGQSAIVSVAQRTPQGFQTSNFVNRRLSQDVFTAVQQRQDLFFYNVRQPATVKTFERVPGATLAGQVNTSNATTVFASVRLQTNTGRNLTYTQSTQTDSNGNFEMTVPYATDDSVSVAEGGTDSGVEAMGNYRLVAGNPFQPSAQGNTTVPETAIYDGATITVEMNPVERDTGNESAGNETGSSNSSSNESALVFPTGSGVSASLDAPGSLTSPNLGQTLAAPRRTADA